MEASGATCRELHQKDTVLGGTTFSPKVPAAIAVTKTTSEMAKRPKQNKTKEKNPPKPKVLPQEVFRDQIPKRRLE